MMLPVGDEGLREEVLDRCRFGGGTVQNSARSSAFSGRDNFFGGYARNQSPLRTSPRGRNDQKYDNYYKRKQGGYEDQSL